MKKIIALITVAAIILTFAGCSENAYVIKVNGENKPAGIFILCQFRALGEAQGKLSEANPDIDFAAADLDYEKYKVEDKDYYVWVNDRALELNARFYVIENMFDERGLSFTDDEKKTFSDEISNEWNGDLVEQAYYMFGMRVLRMEAMALAESGLEVKETWGDYLTDAGVSEESYKLCYFNDKKAAVIFDDMYIDEDATDPPSDEEWEAAFDKEYIRIKKFDISILSKDEQGNAGEKLPDDEIAKRRAFAEEILKQLEDGEITKYAIVEEKYHYAFEHVHGADPTNDVCVPKYCGDEGVYPEGVPSEETPDDSETETPSETPAPGSPELPGGGALPNGNTPDLGSDGSSLNMDQIGELIDIEYKFDEYIKVADYPDDVDVQHKVKMKKNVYEIYETDKAIQILEKLETLGNLGNDEVRTQYKTIVSTEIRVDVFDNLLLEQSNAWLGSADVDVDKLAIKKYTPRLKTIGLD